MQNFYVKQMRDILEKYYAEQAKLNQKIIDNNERYSPQVASSENAKVQQEKEALRESVRGKINAVFEEVRTLLACSAEWNTDTEEFERVQKLMNSGIDFTEQEINSLLQKHQNDYTIVRMIGDTVKKNNPSLYDRLDITSPLTSVEAYKKFAMSALYVADKIYQNHWSADLSLQNFDDPTINDTLYKTVGSGANLKKFNYQNAPISAMHDFDAITLD